MHYNVAARRATGLPVASVLVLLRPKANATDLTGELVSAVGGAAYLTFRYTVVRVRQEPMEPFLTAGPGLAPLALLTNEAAGDLNAAFVRFDRRLRQPDVPGNLRESLLGSTYTLGGLRYAEERLLELYMSLNNILEDSTTYQGIIRRGETRGTQKVLLVQGQKRFGPPSVQAEAAIRGITDLPRLERMAERVLDAAGWDDLLATE